MDDDDGNSGSGTTTGGGGGGVYPGCNLHAIRWHFDKKVDYNLSTSLVIPVCDVYGCVKEGYSNRPGNKVLSNQELGFCGEHRGIGSRSHYTSQNPDGTILLKNCSKTLTRFVSKCGLARMDEIVSIVPGNNPFVTTTLFKKEGKGSVSISFQLNVVQYVHVVNMGWQHHIRGARIVVIISGNVHDVCPMSKFAVIMLLKRNRGTIAGVNSLYNLNASLRCEALLNEALKNCDRVLPNGESLSKYIIGGGLRMDTRDDDSYGYTFVHSNHIMHYPHGSSLNWDGETNERDHAFEKNIQ